MDLNEAAQRVLRRHWALILLLMLVGVAVPYQLDRMQSPSYEAAARFTIGSWDTRDAQQAAALADTATALATSPDTVSRVLDQTGRRRDPLLLVEGVHVAPVGTSGVLELTVTDGDPAAAAEITNGLAAEVVRLRDDAILGGSRQTLAQLDQQIGVLSLDIIDIENQALATVARGGDVSALALRHAQAVENRSALESQRAGLVDALSTTEAPRIIDASATRGVLVTSALYTRLAIGGLLGLVLGVTLAAALESWRPTLTGPAIARHLRAPLLARLPWPPRPDTVLGIPWLANYLTLAADAAGVSRVQLFPVGPPLDVSGLAEELDDADGGGPRVVPFSPRVAPFSLDARAAGSEALLPGTGTVAVVPDVVQGTAMFADLERHTELARQPVIGVITYRGRVRVITYRGRVRRRDRRAAAAQHIPLPAGERTTAPSAG